MSTPIHDIRGWHHAEPVASSTGHRVTTSMCSVDRPWPSAPKHMTLKPFYGYGRRPSEGST